MPTPVVKPLLVQPVPARNSATILATDGAVGGPLVIRDMAGRVVYQSQVPSVQFDIDLSGFPVGRYIVWTAIGAADLLVH